MISFTGGLCKNQCVPHFAQSVHLWNFHSMATFLPAPITGGSHKKSFSQPLLSYVNISHFQDYFTPNTQLQRFRRIKPTSPWSTDYFCLRIKQLHHFQSSCSRKKTHLTHSFFTHHGTGSCYKLHVLPDHSLPKCEHCENSSADSTSLTTPSCWVGSALVPLIAMSSERGAQKNTSTEITKALGAFSSAPWCELG